MNRLKAMAVNALAAMRRPAMIWAVAGLLVWLFLATPYLLRTMDCVFEPPATGRVMCLKPVAQKLRQDSNIATYATATVAAIIAMQLANRNRDEAARRDRDAAQ